MNRIHPTGRACGISAHVIKHIKPKSCFIYDSPNHPGFKSYWSMDNLKPSETKKKADSKDILHPNQNESNLRFQ